MWIQTKGKFNLIRWLSFHFDAFELDFGSLTRCAAEWVCVREAQQNHKLCLLLSFDIFYMKKQSDRELKRNGGNVCDWNVYVAKAMDEKSAALYAMPSSTVYYMLCAAANLIMACENTQNVRLPELVCRQFLWNYMFIFGIYISGNVSYCTRTKHTQERERWANCITMIMLLWGWKWK